MKGPKNAILAVWGSTALVPVELPSGMKALLKLPDVNELILREALPGDLRELAMQYAQSGIEISKLSGPDLKRFVQFTYELIARMVRYMATPDSEAWDAFRKTGADPFTEGWQPVVLTAAEIAEMDIHQPDLDALGKIAGRLNTPNEVTAISRFDRGLITDVEREAAVAGVEPGAKTGDFATFRGEPGGADGGPDGEDVREASERPTRRSRSSGRLRTGRSRSS